MAEAQGRVRAVLDRLTHLEGSTRTAALIRIGIMPIVWWRYGKHHMFFNSLQPADDFSLRAFMAIALMIFGFLLWIGLFTRVAAPVVAVMMTVWHFHYGHHEGIRDAFMAVNYWAPIVGLVFTDCGKSFSVDRWLAIRRAQREGKPLPEERGSVWGLQLIAFQVSMMYFFGAVDKSDWQWLAGERMERYWMYFYGTSDYPEVWGFHLVMVLGAVGTVIFEYALAVGLWFDKTRKWLIAPGIAMHWGMYVCLPAFQISFQMILCYLAFLPPDRAHGMMETMFGHPPPEPSPDPSDLEVEPGA